MKKKLISLTLICVLLISLCGCIRKTPEDLPGENEGDSQFVWVCKEPFGFFYLPDDNKGYYGFLKGYIEKDGEFICFYSAFYNIAMRTYFQEETSFLENTEWGSIYENESFSGYGDYYEKRFYLEIVDDRMNFFDGELPNLKFNKMRKEAFLEKYGDIEGVRERLE